MSINVEKRILASSTRFFEGGSGGDTWYHCERQDKVAHHNSWDCTKIGSIDEHSNPQAITKLVSVSWYVPKVFHRAVLHRHLAETNVKID